MEKVKLIQGNPDRAEEIRKTLEKWGGANVHDLTLMQKDTYYYVDQFGFFESMHEVIAKELIAKGKTEIYKLPPLKPKYELKPFDKVLVRDDDSYFWQIDFFSRKSYSSPNYICLSDSWRQCIPYEGNEHLLGTRNKPE